MRILRIALHSSVLAVADILGIAIGAAIAYKVTGRPNQFGVQLPIAAGASILLFCVWMLLLNVLDIRKLLAGGGPELIAWFGASLLWAPLLFVPLHYVTQGYVTDVGNLVSLAAYQVPVNLIAVLLLWGSGLARRRGVCT